MKYCQKYLHFIRPSNHSLWSVIDTLEFSRCYNVILNVQMCIQINFNSINFVLINQTSETNCVRISRVYWYIFWFSQLLVQLESFNQRFFTVAVVNLIGLLRLRLRNAMRIILLFDCD